MAKVQVKLTRSKNGAFKVTTKEEAAEALRRVSEYAAEITNLEKEHGILELKEDSTQLKIAATQFMVGKKIDELDLGDSYARVRRDGYDRRWIATDAELEGAPEGAKSIRTILRKKFKNRPSAFKGHWQRITKPVILADELQELVDEGIVTEDEIAPAFVEKQKAPFVRVYPKSEDDG